MRPQLARRRVNHGEEHDGLRQATAPHPPCNARSHVCCSPPHTLSLSPAPRVSLLLTPACSHASNARLNSVPTMIAPRGLQLATFGGLGSSATLRPSHPSLQPSTANPVSDQHQTCSLEKTYMMEGKCETKPNGVVVDGPGTVSFEGSMFMCPSAQVPSDVRVIILITIITSPTAAPCLRRWSQ